MLENVRFVGKALTRTVLIKLLLTLSACGPAFTVKNDGAMPLYVDAIYKDHSRDLAPQSLKAGALLTAPRCWTDIADLYLGYQPNALVKRKFDNLCKPSTCNCAVNASQL